MAYLPKCHMIGSCHEGDIAYQLAEAFILRGSSFPRSLLGPLLIAAVSMVTDVLGIFEGNPVLPNVAVTAKGDAAETTLSNDRGDARDWAETARKLCTATFSDSFDDWLMCYDQITRRAELSAADRPLRQIKVSQ